MKSEIICVGTEILMGEIVDTNSRDIAVELNKIGLDLYHISAVGDNRKRILKQLEESISRSDMVVMCGGLGPTQDDITREVVADFCKAELVENVDSKRKLTQYFISKGRPMTKSNLRQVYFPKGSLVFENKVGTADGFLMEKNDKIICVLPGPPNEMNYILSNHLIPFLEQRADSQFYTEFLNIYGISESYMESRILDLIKGQKNPTIAPYAKNEKLQIRVTSKAEDKISARKISGPIIEKIVDIMGENFFGFGKNLNLEEVVGDFLVKNNLTISTAESCTGGLLAGKLINYSGISAIYNRGYITYSNDAKMEILGVKKDTLDKYGAVSYQTAMEMAKGASLNSKSKIGISTTGIAGPTGETKDKKVGLVYIGIYFDGKQDYIRLDLDGNRQYIRNKSVIEAINFLRLKLGIK